MKGEIFTSSGVGRGHPSGVIALPIIFTFRQVGPSAVHLTLSVEILFPLLSLPLNGSCLMAEVLYLSLLHGA